jgi:hypothetical protein
LGVGVLAAGIDKHRDQHEAARETGQSNEGA